MAFTLTSSLISHALPMNASKSSRPSFSPCHVFGTNSTTESTVSLLRLQSSDSSLERHESTPRSASLRPALNVTLFLQKASLTNSMTSSSGRKYEPDLVETSASACQVRLRFHPMLPNSSKWLDSVATKATDLRRPPRLSLQTDGQDPAPRNFAVLV